jgi:hypothetical protein
VAAVDILLKYNYMVTKLPGYDREQRNGGVIAGQFLERVKELVIRGVAVADGYEGDLITEEMRRFGQAKMTEIL